MGTKKNCRHKKGIILAYANYVEFTPDQEPYTAGVIESCGIESIITESLFIHWCPKCRMIQDIGADGNCETVED